MPGVKLEKYHFDIVYLSGSIYKKGKELWHRMPSSVLHMQRNDFQSFQCMAAEYVTHLKLHSSQ